jgi:hypothetical protein
MAVPNAAAAGEFGRVSPAGAGQVSLKPPPPTQGSPDGLVGY